MKLHEAYLFQLVYGDYKMSLVHIITNVPLLIICNKYVFF